MPLYHAAIRFDHEHTVEFQTALNEWCASITTDYFWVRESVTVTPANDPDQQTQTNPHYHIYMRPESAYDSWTRFRRNFLDNRVRAFKTAQQLPSGNKSSAITKVTDPPGWHRYMCKGDAKGSLPYYGGNPGQCSALTPAPENAAYVIGCHEQYWAINAERIANSINNRKRARSGVDIVTHMVDHCQQNKIPSGNRERIALELLKYYKFLKKPVALNTCVNIVNGIQIAMGNEPRINELAHIIAMRD